jgi:hypothetical protein
MKKTIWNNPEATYRETLAPAMEITERRNANEYLARLIQRDMTLFGLSHEKSYSNQMTNLGYYAGYYDYDTQVRVRALFGADHPVVSLGRMPTVSPYEAGREMARRWQQS